MHGYPQGTQEILWNRCSANLTHPPSSEACFWFCKTNDFVHPLSLKREIRAQVEVVNAKLSCATSFKNCKSKLWKRSFCARTPSKSASWGCETQLSCDTSFKNCKLKLWKRSIRARPLQKLQVELVKTKLSCETSKLASRKKSRKQKCTDTHRKRKNFSETVVRETLPIIHLQRHVFVLQNIRFVHLLSLKNIPVEITGAGSWRQIIGTSGRRKSPHLVLSQPTAGPAAWNNVRPF